MSSSQDKDVDNKLFDMFVFAIQEFSCIKIFIRGRLDVVQHALMSIDML